MEPTPPANGGPEGDQTCPHCGHVVPPLSYCVRCGAALGRGGHRHEYAAHPAEPARAIRLFSTLFPHLPQARYDSFRHAFGLGVAIVAVLVIAGFFPIALVVSALLVPVLFVLYFIEVDLYERAPLPVIGATLAWGVVAGAIVGGLVRLNGGAALADSTPDVMSSVPGAVGLALFGGVLATLGPLALIRHRAFNDVLDGATFGAISGAAFASTVGLFRAGDLLGAGLRPGGDPLPWLARLATLGVAQPVLLATVTGSICAAFWLRYRAPVRDRNALGWLGRPLAAILAGAALITAGALGRVVLDVAGGLISTTIAGLIGLVWLRATIHLGLLEEANESDVGPPSRCLNCGRMTPGHTFCGWCGISLQALPRSAAPASLASASATPAEPAEPSR
ncbi:MAG TPA: hypothetical protein VIB99_05565 [Candidatus Limnocylindrales bacterium]